MYRQLFHTHQCSYSLIFAHIWLFHAFTYTFQHPFSMFHFPTLKWSFIAWYKIKQGKFTACRSAIWCKLILAMQTAPYDTMHWSACAHVHTCTHTHTEKHILRYKQRNMYSGARTHTQIWFFQVHNNTEDVYSLSTQLSTNSELMHVNFTLALCKRRDLCRLIYSFTIHKISLMIGLLCKNVKRHI